MTDKTANIHTNKTAQLGRFCHFMANLTDLALTMIKFGLCSI
ncbi:hypothetical protein [Moraxella lacunata]|nr:hypothetical protein [Moraxella lacunata]